MGARASVARSGKDCPRAAVLRRVEEGARLPDDRPARSPARLCTRRSAARRAVSGSRSRGAARSAVPELEKELELVPAPGVARTGLAARSVRAARAGLRARGGGPRARARDRPDASPRRTSISRARAITRATSTAPTPRCARARVSRAKRSGSSTAAWSISGAAMRRPRWWRSSAPSTSTPPTFQTRADPQSVEPAASYYLGVALRAAGEEERARETLRGVADSWAGTDWADAGEPRARTRVGAARVARARRRHGVRRQRRARRPRDAAARGHQQPGRLPRRLARARRRRPRQVGRHVGRRARAAIAGARTSTSDLHEFDSHFPTASLWLNQALRGDTHLRLRYDFGYAWVGSDPFLVSNGGRLSLIHAWSQRSSTELFGTLVRRRLPRPLRRRAGRPGPPGVQLCRRRATVCGPRGSERARRARPRRLGQRRGISHALALPARAAGRCPIRRSPAATPTPTSKPKAASTRHDAHRFFLGLGVRAALERRARSRGQLHVPRSSITRDVPGPGGDRRRRDRAASPVLAERPAPPRARLHRRSRGSSIPLREPFSRHRVLPLSRQPLHRRRVRLRSARRRARCSTSTSRGHDERLRDRRSSVCTASGRVPRRRPPSAVARGAR